MIVVSVTASDMHDRAGEVLVVLAGVVALVFIIFIVQYHAINSVVYILHPLLRSILLLRQQMHVSNSSSIVCTHLVMLLLYNSS
jgi:hypothetical protein